MNDLETNQASGYTNIKEIDNFDHTTVYFALAFVATDEGKELTTEYYQCGMSFRESKRLNGLKNSTCISDSELITIKYIGDERKQLIPYMAMFNDSKIPAIIKLNVLSSMSYCFHSVFLHFLYHITNACVRIKMWFLFVAQLRCICNIFEGWNQK